MVVMDFRGSRLARRREFLRPVLICLRVVNRKYGGC
jgi:hypothetical protein